MLRSSRSILAGHAILTFSLLAASATVAAAHCCHDERVLGVAAQSELRGGVHGMGGGLTDEPIQRDRPSIGENPDGNTTGLGGGGFGQMQGNSIGNYGAGSLGERGPGGLGALRGDSIHTQPPRPR